jgi:hypothetical protein
MESRTTTGLSIAIGAALSLGLLATPVEMAAQPSVFYQEAKFVNRCGHAQPFVPLLVA